MCSRFQQNSPANEIKRAFGLDGVPPRPNSSEIRPTDQALAITKENRAAMLQWGFSVTWSKQPMINARAETLTEKPTFRSLLEQRCIVPVSSYIEWRTGDRGNKCKNRIFDAAGVPMAMAGLIDGDRFTVITCVPAASIAHIHNRMPVLLTPTGITAWLSNLNYAQVASYLAPFMGDLIAEEEICPPPAQGDLFGA